MLIGVSLGPGDPGLLTLKAVEALRRSARVYVPGELAGELARPYCQPEVLDFPMIEDQEMLEEIWSRNADLVAGHALAGDAAFACLGDVNTFSTFTHLKRLIEERHPEVEVQSIPGVGVVPALAARFGVGLDRSFLVSDGSPQDTVIRIKATRPRELAGELESQGYREFILGRKLFTPEEEIVRGEMPEKSHYFSVLYARRGR
ncbi:MAG: cobalt-factor II C(20)-methyltransferase [Methanosarcinales archaeon]|nr:cobalt-factor II C(20)-methyltransferase [Methanosarcinales archaeon]